MSTTVTTTATPALVCLLLLATAGCGALPGAGGALGAPEAATSTAPSAPAATDATSTAGTDTRTTIPRMPYPDPPANLSDAAVKRLAIEHETARVHNQVRTRDDVEYVDMNYLAGPNATVRNRTARGAWVHVTVHYAYGTDNMDADGVPVESLYLVNESAVEHVARLN